VAAVAAAGFFVPNLWLRRRVEQHLRALSEAVPDFLDLLTTCVEAGMSAEAALVRLAQDLAPASPSLAAELERVVTALQAGAQPEDALRAVAERTDLPELFALTRLFSENRTFGTNLAPALREEATHLRAERARRAEEAASKAIAKLVLPTLLCLLPSVLLLILGPFLLQLFATLQTLE